MVPWIQRWSLGSNGGPLDPTVVPWIQRCLHVFCSKKLWNRKQKTYLFLDPPRGAKWMGVGVPLSNPLGFKHHPLEGAGIMVDFHWGGVPASVKFFPTYVGRWQAFRAYVCIMYLLMFFGWVLVTCRLFANVATACLAWRWGGILSGSFGLRPLNDHSGRWCWRAKVRCVAKKNQVFQSDVGYRKVFARSKRYFEETGLFFLLSRFFVDPSLAKRF